MWARAHVNEMDSSSQIREALRAKLDDRQITQVEIGRALGIAQPNVATLFKPGKNGKLRDISYDEGLKLIERFGLRDADASNLSMLNENLLARLLASLAPALPSGPLSESAARPLAAALRHGLELLIGTGATDPTEREFELAARAAMSQLRASFPS